MKRWEESPDGDIRGFFCGGTKGESAGRRKGRGGARPTSALPPPSRFSLLAECMGEGEVLAFGGFLV